MGLKLVGFFGPDGVGKSTQVDIIYSNLYEKKYPVKKVWIRGPHTLSYLLSVILLKMGFSRIEKNPYGREKKYLNLGQNSLVKNIWAVIEFISVLPLIIFKVLLPIKFGAIIIADRYVLDSIVSIAHNVNDLKFAQSRISKLLFRFIPDESLFFHLDTDYTTLCERRGRLVEPESFIEFQKECYKQLDKRIQSYYIETSQNGIEKISENIRKIIETKLH